jgi:ABC-type multidrug transport system permease subunit
MATKSEINIEKKISDYFENASYDELYSNDIWFTIIVFLIVFCIALYLI